jgi:hypothetical protein
MDKTAVTAISTKRIRLIFLRCFFLILIMLFSVKNLR